MSSFSSNSNAESVVFQIRGSDLSQFYKTNNSHYFTSKSFVINNIIHFQVYIYPNGIDKKNVGNVQFIVVPTQFESSLKSVTVSVKLYSKTLQIMFKEVQTLHKVSDTIEWSQYQLQLSECKKIIIENAIKYLDFVCDIEVLKYKSNNSVSRKWSLQSMRKQSNSSLSSMDTNVFQPLSYPVKSHMHVEWFITNDMVHIFRNTLNGKSYYSQDINKTFCLCVFPNGSKRNPSTGNHFELMLKLLRLPPEIKTIAVDFAVQRYTEHSNELTETLCVKKNILFHYKNTKELATLFKTSELNKFVSFKLGIIIKITKVYKDVGKNGMGEEVAGLWSNYGLDEFPPGRFEFKIDCGQNTSDYYVDDAKTSSSMGNITENIPSLPSSKSLPRNVTITLLQKELSYSTLNMSGRHAANSITSMPSYDHRLSHSSSPAIQTYVKKDSFLKPPAPKSELWEKKSNAIDGLNHLNEEKDNKFTDKFKMWLCDDVQKGKYLQNFISNGCADIRCIKRLNDSDLIACGITNEYDRELILDEVELFKQGQDDLNKLYDKHNGLKSFRKQFRNNAIFTLDDLMSVKQKELHKVLNVEINDTRVIEIWNILHPSQSQKYISQTKESISQLEMKEYQQEYKLSVASTDKLIAIMIKMHKQKNKSVIQQQATSLLYSHWSKVLDQKLMIDELFNKTNCKPELSTTPDLIVKERSFSQSKSSLKKRGSIQQSQSSSQNICISNSQSEYDHIDDSNKLLENSNDKSHSNKSEIIKKSYPKVKESPFVLGQLDDSNDNHASK